MHHYRALIALIPRRWRRSFPLLAAGLLVLAVLEAAVVALLTLFATTLLNAGGEEPIIRIPKTVLRLPGVQGLIESSQSLPLLGAISVVVVLAKCGFFLFLQAAVMRFSLSVSRVVATRLLEVFLTTDVHAGPVLDASEQTEHVRRRERAALLLRSGFNLLREGMVAAHLIAAVVWLYPLGSTLLLGLVGLVGMGVVAYTRPLILRSTSRLRDEEMRVQRVVYGVMRGRRDIKIYSRVAAFVRELGARIDHHVKIHVRQVISLQLPTVLLEAVSITLLIVIIVAMANGMNNRVDQFGFMAILVSLTAWRVLPAGNRILAALTELRRYAPYVDLTLAVMDAAPKAEVPLEDERQRERLPALPLQEQLVLDDVGLSYPSVEGEDRDGEFGLAEISVTLNRGEALGIIGASGSGKSTLVDIICGLTVPTEGSVAIDGAPLDATLRRRWMRSVSYVSQQPYVLAGTLAENLAFAPAAQVEVDETHALRCCEQAGLEGFLARHPEGLSTRIEEEGRNLSGGELQRIALARALYKNVDLLALDEPTSALDLRLELGFAALLRRLKGERTMVIVSHRLGTLEVCDRVLLIEDGGIAALGPPAEVLARFRDGEP